MREILLCHPQNSERLAPFPNRLDAIKSDMEVLGLREAAEPQRPLDRLREKRETTSFVREEEVIGRENDKNIIMGMLLDPKYEGKNLLSLQSWGLGV